MVSKIIMAQGEAMIENLEEALKYIAKLEAENESLRNELQHFKSRKCSGRKKHDETWTSSYNDFVVKYEAGMSIMDIVAMGDVSRRTAYRYKAYYDDLRKNISAEENKE